MFDVLDGSNGVGVGPGGGTEFSRASSLALPLSA